MDFKVFRAAPVVACLVALLAVPGGLHAKKPRLNRGMLEKMDGEACGAQQRGVTGIGTLWASAGIAHVNTQEKLCAQYLLRTDDYDYEIRPTDKSHPDLLPVGHEAEFRIKKNMMFLRVGDSGKEKTYEVVGIKPANGDVDAQRSSASTNQSSDNARPNDNSRDKN